MSNFAQPWRLKGFSVLLLSKVRSLKLCPLAILMPLEENPYTVPHLKALNSGQNLWGGQRCGSTLSL